ncbi:MAG: DUF1540 domain-containing protein [Sarcina sp.]
MNHNSNICCNVKECKNHCSEDDFCTLTAISIVKQSANKSACSKECTDCGSFELK